MFRAGKKWKHEKATLRTIYRIMYSIKYSLVKLLLYHLIRRKIYLFLITAALFLASSLICHAQNAFKNEKELIKKSEINFSKEDYTTALPLYSQLLSLYPKNPLYNYRFGVSMLFSDKRDAEKPLKYLEYAVKYSGIPESFYYLGLAYHRNYRFAEAIRMYEAYKKISRSSVVEKLNVNRQIEMCRNGMELLSAINDLYVLDKKSVNNKAYFRSYNLKKFGGKFLAKPENLKTKTDKKYKDNSLVFFSDSNEVIYYSSYGNDLKNGKDIYYSSKISDKDWSKPVRLSDVVNTPYDEDFPYLMPDGKTLYFSSKGHNSMGGYDIFVTTFDSVSNEWMTPVNIDFAINTPYDDYMFVTDKDSKYAYFSSDRNSPPNQVSVYLVRIDKRPLATENILLSGDTSVNISRDSLYAKSIAILKEKARLNVNATPEMFGDTILAVNLKKDTTAKRIRHNREIQNVAVNDSLYTMNSKWKDSLANVAFTLADKANREKEVLNEKKYSAYSYAKKYRQLFKERLNQAKQIEDISVSENNPGRKTNLNNTAERLKKSSAEYYTLSVAAGKLAVFYQKQADKKDKAHDRYVNIAAQVQIHLAKNNLDSARYYLKSITDEVNSDTHSNDTKSVLTELNKPAGDTLQKAYSEAFISNVISEVDLYIKDTLFIENKVNGSRDILAYNKEISKTRSGQDTSIQHIPVVLNVKTVDTTANPVKVTNVNKKEATTASDKKKLEEEKVKVLKLADKTIRLLEKERIMYKKQSDSSFALFQKNNRQADLWLKRSDSVLNKAYENPKTVNATLLKHGYIYREKYLELKNNTEIYNNLAINLRDSASQKNTLITDIDERKKSMKSISGMDSLEVIHTFLTHFNPEPKLNKPSLNQLIVNERVGKIRKDSMEMISAISPDNRKLIGVTEQKINALKDGIDDLQKKRDYTLSISNIKYQQAEQKLKEAYVILNNIQNSSSFVDKQDAIKKAQTLKKEAVTLGREAVAAYTMVQKFDSLVNKKLIVLNNLSENLFLAQFEVKSGNYKKADSSLTLLKPVLAQKEHAFNPLPELSNSGYLKNVRYAVTKIEKENAQYIADVSGFADEINNYNAEISSTRNKKKQAALLEKREETQHQTEIKKEKIEINRKKLDSLNTLIYQKEQELTAFDNIQNDIVNIPPGFKDTLLGNEALFAKKISAYSKKDIFSEQNDFLKIDTSHYFAVNNNTPETINNQPRDTGRIVVGKDNINPQIISINDSQSDTLKALAMLENAKLISSETDILIKKRTDPLISNSKKLEIDYRVFILKSESDSLYKNAVKIFSEKKKITREEAENILVKNNVEPEMPVIIQNINRISENLSIHSSQIRNMALGNSNALVKSKLNKQADSLEDIALNYQFRGIDYQMLNNRNRYISNNIIIENIRSEGVTDDRLSVAALLEKEAADYLAKSDDNRKKAVNNLYLNSRLMLLQDALTFEKQALDKQQQAISIYRKINPKAPDDKTIIAQLTFKNKTLNTGNNRVDVSPGKKEKQITVNKYINNNQTDTSIQINNKIILYNEDNPIPENENLPEGVVFKVQILASKSLVKVSSFKGISPLSMERKPDFEYIRYMAGLFTLYNDALKARDKLRKSGFSSAFIVAYYNGYRVSVQEGLAMMNGRKNKDQNIIAIADQKFNGNASLPPYESILSFSGYYYSVQIGVFSKQRLFPGLQKSASIYYDRYNNRYWRYFSGKFNDLNTAKNQKAIVVNYGIRDAFIVAFLNGKRLKSLIESRVSDTIPEKKQSIVISRQKADTTARVVFAIQIGAFSKDVPMNMFQSDIINEKLDIRKYQREDKIYIIYSGNFSHYADAISWKTRLVSLGFKDAFVIALRNGKKVPITGKTKLQ